MNTFAEMVLPQPTTTYLIPKTVIPNTVIPSTLLHDEEHSAIARALKGDLDAFNELVIKYQNLAYGIAFRLLQSREAASDAVQDSFIKAFRSLATFKNGSFKSWLARIVVNTCYDALRANRRVRWEEITDEPTYDLYAEGGANAAYQIADKRESPQEFVERMELGARIELGLRALPERQRLVVMLYDIYGYSYEEICEITNLPAGTVKSSISRARLRLRNFLLEQPELLPMQLLNLRRN
ncbi:MAG: sigma-70 family RNA polymerase sigma factor [Caldilineaceae bacterium]|nr:sigma-70 family RNA polymerase sigma factor [Caldilineaceae bacterium]